MRLPRLGSRRFAPRLVPTVAMLALGALCVALGQWQLGRAAEKRALAAEFARGDAAPVALPPVPDGARYARVAVSGRYLAARQFLLDNMTHEGQAGYRVLTPLESDGGTLVLVDRGWLPVGANRALLPPVAVGEAPRRVTGRLDRLPRAGIELAATAERGWPRRVSYPRLAELEAALGRPLYPAIVLLDPTAADGYVRDWQPPAPGPERHLGYALQWFAFAATLVACWFVVSLRPPGRPA
ncbi:MAG: SURF1 family protein [Proteobacteria bacterium]|nr:SURF1 family protein [Pseudomonadota bacterium]